MSNTGGIANLAWTETTKKFTVLGLNFVTTDYTPSARLGTGECTTLSWVSFTAAYCVADLVNPLALTVGGIVGTKTFQFTYDGAPRLKK